MIVLNQSLLLARAWLALNPPARVERKRPDGTTYTTVRPREWIRQGGQALAAYNLVLRARDVTREGSTLVMRFRLAHQLSGDTDEWTRSQAMDIDVPLALAAAWAETRGLAAAIKALLWDVANEDVPDPPESAPAKPVDPVALEDARRAVRAAAVPDRNERPGPVSMVMPEIDDLKGGAKWAAMQRESEWRANAAALSKDTSPLPTADDLPTFPPRGATEPRTEVIARPPLPHVCPACGAESEVGSSTGRGHFYCSSPTCRVKAFMPPGAAKSDHSPVPSVQPASSAADGVLPGAPYGGEQGAASEPTATAKTVAVAPPVSLDCTGVMKCAVRGCLLPPVCIGRYESEEAWHPSCAEHCGHGNEDGKCEPITQALIDEMRAALTAERAAGAPVESSALTAVRAPMTPDERRELMRHILSLAKAAIRLCRSCGGNGWVAFGSLGAEVPCDACKGSGTTQPAHHSPDLVTKGEGEATPDSPARGAALSTDVASSPSPGVASAPPVDASGATPEGPTLTPDESKGLGLSLSLRDGIEAPAPSLVAGVPPAPQPSIDECPAPACGLRVLGIVDGEEIAEGTGYQCVAGHSLVAAVADGRAWLEVDMPDETEASPALTPPSPSQTALVSQVAEMVIERGLAAEARASVALDSKGPENDGGTHYVDDGCPGGHRDLKPANVLPASWKPGAAWKRCKVVKTRAPKLKGLPPEKCAIGGEEIPVGTKVYEGLPAGGVRKKKRSGKPVGRACLKCVEDAGKGAA